MSEFRQDSTTGAWVVVAPGRGRRPGGWHRAGAADAALPAYDPACPFCPGNEHLLPDIIEQTASSAHPGWLTRVVPNKYPALAPATAVPSAGAMPGYGFHEVVIETPRHDGDLTTRPEGEVRDLVGTYRRRHTELMARPGIAAALVFRNHGRRAGSSLPHPHSQVIALGMMPPRMAAAAAWARRRHEAEGGCVTCARLERELADGRRIVEADAHFVVLVPFAAQGPFEQLIVPRRHHASFVAVGDLELDGLSRVLQRALRRQKTLLGDPPYNYAIDSFGIGHGGDALAQHWELRIVPDLATPGGFELGAGLPINPSLPEDDAAILRGTQAAS